MELSNRSINTHDILQKKLLNCSLSPSVYCFCYKDSEHMDHLFLHCPFASDWWSFLFTVLSFVGCRPRAIEDQLMEIVQGCSYKGKAKILWGCAIRAFLWNLWKERNNRVFTNLSHSFDSFCNYVQINASSWCLNDKVFICKYSLTMLSRDWRAVLHQYFCLAGALSSLGLQAVLFIINIHSFFDKKKIVLNYKKKRKGKSSIQ